jgi:transcriptional antiterminator NusG
LGWFGCSTGLALGFRVNIFEQATTESADAGDMRWYILKVQFNREDTIRESLEKRIRLSSLASSFGEILVPTEDVVEFTRAGKRRVVKRKLYPGYLVIRMIINDDTWFLVRETGGVGDFTGSGGKPTPMSDADVERILKMAYPDADEEQVPKTTIPFRPGDRIRVKEGNFQSLEGDVDRIDEANGRVTVIISIFGRSTPVELDHWQIESL